MEPTQSSETSAHILRTPGKFPKEYLLQQANMYQSTVMNTKSVMLFKL